MKPRILIVDDEKEFVETLAQRLTIRDYDVTTAFSGEEAIETVKGYNFDVVILDVLMPGMGGLEVLRRIKTTYKNTRITAIIRAFRKFTLRREINLALLIFKVFSCESIVI